METLEEKLSFFDRIRSSKLFRYTSLALAGLGLMFSMDCSPIKKIDSMTELYELHKTQKEYKAEDFIETKKTTFTTVEVKPKTKKLEINSYPIKMEGINPSSLREEHREGDILFFVDEFSYLHPDYRLLKISLGENSDRSFYAVEISPDGKNIVGYMAEEEESDEYNRNVCLVDLERKIAVEILNNGKDDIDPSISDDGRRIAFTSVKVDTLIKKDYLETSLGSQEIMLADLLDSTLNTIIKSKYKEGNYRPPVEPATIETTSTGQVLTRLSVTSYDPPLENPTDRAIISEYGNKIAIETKIVGDQEVFTFDIDRSILTNISNHPTIDELFGISSDGYKILFGSYREAFGYYTEETESYLAYGGQPMRIFLADTEKETLTKFFPSIRGGENFYYGIMSRNGQRVLIETYRGVSSFDFNNNRFSDMTSLRGSTEIIDISLDGNLILFTGTGNAELYTWNENQNNRTKIATYGLYKFWRSKFSDDGSRIVIGGTSYFLEKK